MNRPASLALGALMAILVATGSIAYQAAFPEDDALPTPTPSPTQAGAAQPFPILGADIQAHVDHILTRPLFEPTRRPPPGASAPAALQSPLPRLTAIVVSSRGKTVIFAGADKPVAVAEGGHIGTYVVQAIGAGQATVRGPDGVHVLRPAADGAPASTATIASAQPSILDLLRQSAPSTAVPGYTMPAQSLGTR